MDLPEAPAVDAPRFEATENHLIVHLSNTRQDHPPIPSQQDPVALQMRQATRGRAVRFYAVAYRPKLGCVGAMVVAGGPTPD